MPIRKQLLLTCSENKGGICKEKKKKKEEESGATWKNKTRKKPNLVGDNVWRMFCWLVHSLTGNR